jgi:histidinol dehydrogenase
MNSESLVTQLNLVRRKQKSDSRIERSVRNIIKKVRRQGDAALFELTEQYDGAILNTLIVFPEEDS